MEKIRKNKERLVKVVGANSITTEVMEMRYA